LESNDAVTLISLILRHFDIWPIGASCATQEADGVIIFWSCPLSLIRTAMQLKGSTSVRSYLRFEDITKVFRAENVSTDQTVAIVRKEEFEFYSKITLV
jgi:hypothetical protein